MSPEGPTKQIHWARVGDTVRVVNADMRGEVIRIMRGQSGEGGRIARVKWASGSEGRHTLAALVVVERKEDRT